MAQNKTTTNTSNTKARKSAHINALLVPVPLLQKNCLTIGNRTTVAKKPIVQIIAIPQGVSGYVSVSPPNSQTLQ